MQGELNQSRYAIQGALELMQGAFTSRSFKPHFHSSYTLILVESGVADYSYRKDEYIVEANKLLVLNPYEVHTGKLLSSGIWHFRSMYVPAQWGVQYDKAQEQQRTSTILRDTHLLARYQMLHHQLMQQTIDIDIETQIADLLGEIFQIKDSKLIANQGHDSVAALSKVRDYIHAHYDEAVTLDQLIQVSGMSRYYLVHSFKKRYGLPPHQYLNNLRIEKAKMMLQEGLPSLEAALSSGYFDQSHFIRHFKKIVGTTPTQYRQGIRV